MENTLNKTLPSAANTVLDAPVTMEEFHLAVRSGKPNTAPGDDGICKEFFKVTWETTKYDMLEVFELDALQRENNGTTETWDISMSAKQAYT